MSRHACRRIFPSSKAMKPKKPIETLILNLRNQKVILDADLAGLYGVPAYRFNEAVKRNLDRFPEDFMFRLTKEEWEEQQALRSQIAILKLGRGQHRKYLPYAFTEHGALMAANILHSPRAVAMSVYAIRAFVKMREDLATNAAKTRNRLPHQRGCSPLPSSEKSCPWASNQF